jgi:hypothetical protein
MIGIILAGVVGGTLGHTLKNGGLLFWKTDKEKQKETQQEITETLIKLYRPVAEDENIKAFFNGKTNFTVEVKLVDKSYVAKIRYPELTDVQSNEIEVFLPLKNATASLQSELRRGVSQYIRAKYFLEKEQYEKYKAHELKESTFTKMEDKALAVIRKYLK